MDLFGFGHLFNVVVFFTSVLKNSFKPQFGFKIVKSKKAQTQETQQILFFFCQFYIVMHTISKSFAECQNMKIFSNFFALYPKEVYRRCPGGFW